MTQAVVALDATLKELQKRREALQQALAVALNENTRVEETTIQIADNDREIQQVEALIQQLLGDN